MPIRLAVTGGRNFADGELVGKALDAVHRKRGVAVLICGMADGADTLAARWAGGKGIEIEEYPVTPADWKSHGKAAGPIRNQRMVDSKPDAAVAFPGGAGTADMTKRCEKAGIPVWKVAR